MDKSRKKRISVSKLALPVLLAGIILGVALIGYGLLKVKSLSDEISAKSTEEIGVDMHAKAIEHDKYNRAALEEFQKNGITDKYLELYRKSSDLSKEITALSDIRYRKETGYNNPNSLDRALKLAPTIWIGTIVIIAGFVAFIVMREQK